MIGQRVATPHGEGTVTAVTKSDRWTGRDTTRTSSVRVDLDHGDTRWFPTLHVGPVARYARCDLCHTVHPVERLNKKETGWFCVSASSCVSQTAKRLAYSGPGTCLLCDGTDVQLHRVVLRYTDPPKGECHDCAKSYRRGNGDPHA